MYNAATFRVNVIDPTLRQLHLYSSGMSDLLLGTAVHESGGFKWNRQYPTGPGRGYFQMEGATHDDIWSNYLKYHHKFAGHVNETLSAGEMAAADTMVTNDYYAAAMAAVLYKRKKVTPPFQGNPTALALLWKRHYNTDFGAGSVDQFTKDWKAYIK